MTDSGDKSERPPENPEGPPEKITTYVAIAAGAFLAALAVLFVMVQHAEALVRLGLVDNLYYITLVPLGLAVAAFLFGVLRSHAVYTGKVEGGSIELGGPIVGFVLVVMLGFKLLPNPQPSALTIFVHGEKGRQDVILRNDGSVMLDLGGHRRREPIGDKGQAYFAGIPSTFRGQSIAVAVEAEGYEPVTPDGMIKVDGDSAYVAIRPKAAELAGYVRSVTGQPIAGATISVAGNSAQTDRSGFFKLTLPGAGPSQSVGLQVAAPGFAAWNTQVVPGGGEIAIALDRATQ